MPLVDYECKEDGIFTEIHNFDDEYEAKCPICGDRGKRIWSNFNYTVDFRAGWDPGLGKYVDTKRQREVLLEENNLRRVKD